MDDPAGLVLRELDGSDPKADGGLINGILVSLEQYQTPDDQGAVGEGPDADVIPPLRPPH
jgi:hypothetical protein